MRLQTNFEPIVSLYSDIYRTAYLGSDFKTVFKFNLVYCDRIILSSKFDFKEEEV